MPVQAKPEHPVALSSLETLEFDQVSFQHQSASSPAFNRISFQAILGFARSRRCASSIEVLDSVVEWTLRRRSEETFPCEPCVPGTFPAARLSWWRLRHSGSARVYIPHGGSGIESGVSELRGLTIPLFRLGSQPLLQPFRPTTQANPFPESRSQHPTPI